MGWVFLTEFYITSQNRIPGGHVFLYIILSFEYIHIFICDKYFDSNIFKYSFVSIFSTNVILWLRYLSGELNSFHREMLYFDMNIFRYSFVTKFWTQIYSNIHLCQFFIMSHSGSDICRVSSFHFTEESVKSQLLY